MCFFHMARLRSAQANTMLPVLVFYIHLVSTSASDDSALQNFTMHFEKFLGGIDPTLLFGAPHGYVMDVPGKTTVPPILHHPIAPKISRRQAQSKKTRTTTTKAESPFAKNMRLKQTIYDMMQQFLYSGQELLWPVAPILAKYENLSPFRMAFIFGELEQLTRDANSIMAFVERRAELDTELSVTQSLQVYWDLMMKNVDVTYMVDYIKEHAPQDNITAFSLRVLQKEKENIEREMLAGPGGRRQWRARHTDKKTLPTMG